MYWSPVNLPHKRRRFLYKAASPPRKLCARCLHKSASLHKPDSPCGWRRKARHSVLYAKGLESSFQHESILDGMVVTQIGVGRMPAAPIDQRINAAKGVPLPSPHDDCSHLVVVGDSSGTVSYFVVSEKIKKSVSQSRVFNMPCCRGQCCPSICWLLRVDIC